MVKLFVGNLADTVDSFRLRNLFLEYVDVVQECDVLKNFAFVHVVSDRDAETVISKLDRYNLEGKEIHIERSTSRLRKEPGMGDKCFTCGKADHKTPNCPQEMERRIRMGDAKPVKRERPGSPSDGPPSKITVNLCQPGSNYGYGANGSLQNQAQSTNPADHDPEFQRPADPDLQQIYQQYIEARQRYFYYRDRLGKELSLRPAGGPPQQLPSAGAPVPMAAAAPPVNYAAPQQSYVPAQPAAPTNYAPAAPTHPYGGGSSYYQQPQQQPTQQLYTSTSAPSYAPAAPSHPYQQPAQAPQQQPYGYQPPAAVQTPPQQRAPYYSQTSSAPAQQNPYGTPASITSSSYGTSATTVTNLSGSGARQTIGSFPPQPTRR